ncbi:Outer membrane porin F precursor [compost metagenome]
MGSSNYTNDQLGFYVSNFRIAEGSGDMRSKLLSGGKLETSGILFATNSAEIKSDSEGTIKEVATVLSENPEMKIRIIGHTDAVGNASANLTLSKKRADAVRDILINDYQIKITQIETDGKGDTSPVADESSEQNKAKNRRVEFVRI